MRVSDYTLQIRDMIRKADNIALITDKNPSLDEIYSLCAWYNLLRRRNKKLRLFAPQIDRNSLPEISCREKLEQNLPRFRTVIRLNLEGKGLEQVTYKVQGGDLYVYITPRTGQVSGEKLKSWVEYLAVGVIIALGVTRPQNLPDWPPDWPKQLSKHQTLLNLDINLQNEQYGQLNLVEERASSLCELSFEVFKQLNWEVEPESADLLIKGIRDRTSDFREYVTPETFERMAELTRLGSLD